MNFGDLKQNIVRYLEDNSTELRDALPEIVRQAEQTIYRMAPMLPCYQFSYAGSYNFANRTELLQGVPFPDGMLVIDSVFCETGDRPATANCFLEKREESYLRDLYPTLQGEPGYPGYYFTRNYRIFPVPIATNASFALTIDGHGPEGTITGSDDATSWISLNARNALLHTSLSEACNVLRRDGSIYMNQAVGDIEALKGEAMGVATSKGGIA